MIRICAGLALLLAMVLPARAQTDIGLAEGIGRIIGGQEACGYKLDSTMLSALITKRVPADDLKFAENMNLYTRIQKREFERYDQVQRDLNCMQMRRIIKEGNLEAF